MPSTTLTVTTPMDSGNITLIHTEDPTILRLAITPDNNSLHFQWFNFYLNGLAEQQYVLVIENAGQASFPRWNDHDTAYQVYGSYDDKTWQRFKTTYEPELGHLRIEGTLSAESLHFAFYPPYPYAKHLTFLASLSNDRKFQREHLGKTLDDRDITLITVGTPAPHKKKCWIIAAQHPGETMAQWCMEGLFERLRSDELHDFFEDAVLYIVPNMNPDGNFRGHLRTNAAGEDLNRAWKNPTLESTPEVYYVLRRMQDVGIDFFLDVHGDEGIPYVFFDSILGSRTTQKTTEKYQGHVAQHFIQAWMSINPNIQDEVGYEDSDEVERMDDIDTRFATGRISWEFECVALILEMPFKENKNHPHPNGWTINDCKQIGADILTPLQCVLPLLKSKPAKERLTAPRSPSFLSSPKLSVEEREEIGSSFGP